MSYYARVTFHPCTLRNSLLCKYFHGKPTVVEQGFPQCYPESVWRKIHKDSAGTWCYSAAKASSPLPAPVFSQLHNLWEDEEGCVGWGTFMSQEAFCSWACDWLYGHSLCCDLTKWNGKCFWALQECLEVAEVFDEQPGWDLSLVRAFCCVNIA